MTTFNGLAPEIHVMFMLLVGSIDVITLRQTCRVLYAASFERSVWLKLAREARVERSLFIPDCTLSAMTAFELERVVCGHYMWNALAAKNPREDKVLEPLSRSTLTIPQPQPPEDKSMVSSCGHVILRLVPGGSFLVGVSTVALCIWKISPRNTGKGSHQTLQPISTVKICQNPKSEAYRSSFHDVLVARTPDGEGLRVALQYCNYWASRTKYICNIYEIDFKLKNPEFRMIVSRPTPRWDITTQLCAMVGDVMLITMDGWEIVLWNFVENTWACWMMEQSNGFYTDNVLLTPEHVLIMTDNDLLIWKIPPLRDDPALGGSSFHYHGYPPEEEYLPPDFGCKLPTPPVTCSDRKKWTWCLPHQWYNSSEGLPSTFFGMRTSADEQYSVNLFHGHLGFLRTHHTLHPIASRRDHPNPIPDELRNGLNVPLYVFPPDISPTFCSDSHSDTAFTVGDDQNCVKIYTSKSVGQQLSGTDKDSLNVIPVEQFRRWYEPEFSPASGRLVFFNKEAGIDVWDFLP